jgi:hypothetical protein
MIGLRNLKIQFVKRFPNSRLSKSIFALPDEVSEFEFLGIARMLLVEACLGSKDEDNQHSQSSQMREDKRWKKSKKVKKNAGQ